MAEEKRPQTQPKQRPRPAVREDDQGARELVAQASEAAAAGLATMSDGPGDGLGPLGAPLELTPTDITDQLEKGGPAFGSFVKSIGLAVAEAQAKLDETLVKTAKALSETQIDVIAVFEQQINDDTGQMEKGIPHIQKLPLVNYLMPTAYQWSRVHLEADMDVSEFSAANGINIQSRSNHFSAGASGSYSLFGGFGARGYVGYGSSSSSVDVGTQTANSSSAGELHMEATLEPRGDIKLPQPFVTQKGPRLKVTVDSVTPIEESVAGANGAPATKKRVGTKATLTAILEKSTGGPNSGKQLEISVSEPTITYEMKGDAGKTDGDGKMTITLERKGAAYVDGEPVQTLVRVWFGLAAIAVPVVM
jgi:hypothetical protein